MHSPNSLLTSDFVGSLSPIGSEQRGRMRVLAAVRLHKHFGQTLWEVVGVVVEEGTKTLIADHVRGFALSALSRLSRAPFDTLCRFMSTAQVRYALKLIIECPVVAL